MMKRNSDFDLAIDEFIKLYAVRPKRRTLKKKEIEDFLRFVYAATVNDTKYKQMQKHLIEYIRQFDEEIYTKIRETFFNIHNRSTNNQGIRSSKKIGIGRRRAR